MNGAVIKALLQTKIPPDMQGRVFAFDFSLTSLTAPLSFLITGPLVDKLVEPAVGGHGLVSWLSRSSGARPGQGWDWSSSRRGDHRPLDGADVRAARDPPPGEGRLPDYAARPVVEGDWEAVASTTSGTSPVA